MSTASCNLPIYSNQASSMNQWSAWRLRTRRKTKNSRKTKRRTWAKSCRRNAACGTRVCNPAGHKGEKRKEKEEEKGKEEKEGAKHLAFKSFKNLVVLSKRSFTSQEKRRKSPSYSNYSDDCIVWRVWEDPYKTGPLWDGFPVDFLCVIWQWYAVIEYISRTQDFLDDIRCIYLSPMSIYHPYSSMISIV